MMRTLVILIFSFCSALTAAAQQNAAVIDYINSYKQLAIDEMQRTGVPASIKLAQGIHETEAGRSELVLKSNNHFGIKCKSNWAGPKVYHDDDARGECFRSYDFAADSYRDHSNFLKNSQRYAFLFELNPEDYKGWAYGLKKAGYATNIKYSQILIRIIETYDLQQYTLIALGKLKPSAEILAGITVPLEKTEDPAAQPELTQVAATPPVNYPDGIFQINETRVIFVKGGTSLLAVANRHELTLARLLEFNDMTAGEGDILNEDQLVYLQRKRRTGANSVHLVQPEETLYDIAQAEGIRYENILLLNDLQPGMEPALGEKIYLKEKAPARPALLVVKNEQSMTRHVVKYNETIYGISKKYGVTAQQIKQWNRLSGHSLRKGQELIIYTN
jgi:LysM repeat protein